MSKITRISAALALMVAVVSGCKSNNNVAGGDCGCAGTPGAVGTTMGAPVTTHAPAGMTTPISGGAVGGMGSSMPTGSSTFAPASQGMGGSQFSR